MKYIIRSVYFLYFSFFILHSSCAQPLHQNKKFTQQDTLRGSITPERAWWNVTYYDIHVTPDYNSKTISGWNEISFVCMNNDAEKNKMQIDLQQPMGIDSILFNGKEIESFSRNENVYLIDLSSFYFIPDRSRAIQKIKIYFHGKPREAIRPPWDGGWIWTKDEKGRPWMTVACQGLGASVWYPCKDIQSDEPDNGASLTITVSDTLMAIANGRLTYQSKENGLATYTWEVKNPINNYNIVPYIGKYADINETYKGEKGNLDCNYWVMDYNVEKAREHFREVPEMLKAFEYWFGPYPFYEDGYKLVESSHLGMEHQSDIAYGNHYKEGYLGMDLSGTGWGMKWDYIIVHESGHEWFGNNITTNDIADMWVHEGFAMYSEALFIEYNYGKEAADRYIQGLRRNISNDNPLIGFYGVNQEGSGDMYNKGANMLHTIRQVINDDAKFRTILRGLNQEFYHQTINSKDAENYISKQSGKDLSEIFDQYLRTTKIPALEYKMTGKKLFCRWANCVSGFNMPVEIGAGKSFWVYPETKWQPLKLPAGYSINDINKNFYITVKKGS